MDDLKTRFLVVGAGPAGCSAAKVLIEQNHLDDVLLIGREATLAYERPPLSKQALLETDLQPQLLSESIWLVEHSAETLLETTVISVNCSEKYVTTDKNQKIFYEYLLLTVGADARTLNIPGENLKGVCRLRDFQDAEALKPYLKPNNKMIVVGNGFIGLEVAATAKQLGLDVTVIGLTERVMSRSMPIEVSQVFEQKFKENGITFLFNQSLKEIHGDTKVHSVQLQDGKILEADAVVVGVGAYPNSTAIQGIQHLINNGIKVNAYGQTADPYIFAAGDVANRATQFADQTFSLRLEAWEPAREQGRAIAEFISSQKQDALPLPWMWSDQFDWNLQAIGYGHLATQQVCIGSKNDAKFTLLQLNADGQLLGAITVNNGKDMTLCRRALKNNTFFDVEELSGVGVEGMSLKQILALSKVE